MRKIILIIIAAVAAFTLSAQKVELLWKTDTVMRNPETTLFDSKSNRIFVSNINGNMFAKDGNGFISKMKTNGEIEQLKWIDGLNGPKGMEIHKGILYVTDIDELVLIDLKKAKVISKHKAEGSKFLNDVAIDKKGQVYISDNRANQIFRFSNNKMELWLSSDSFSKINGMMMVENEFYVCSDKIMKINVQSKQIQTILRNTGEIDGIEMLQKNQFLFSNWKGKINITNGSEIVNLVDYTKVIPKTGIGDIDYITSSRTILAPTLSGNYVAAFKLTQPEIPAKPVISKDALIKTIDKVNTYWQSTHVDPGNPFWDNAAYHTGNMEAYKVTGNEKYREYSEKWAIQNEWKGAKGTDISKWKYKYGETSDHVLFGDWQICFQTYIDLYNLAPDSIKIARAIEVMEYQMSTPNNDYWWWVDGLYMVMPVMTKLYKLTGNKMYLNKLYEYYKYSESIMFDPDTKLFYRDAKYIYPAHKSVNGKKDFWSRGNGWLFAGLAKILQDLPANYEHKAYFELQFKNMAESLAKAQQKEGYWTRSLLDPLQASGFETSGTAFFTYGYLWGINNGYLKEKRYKEVALKGWKYLSEIALQPNGLVGYVQPIGERAIAGQILNPNSTTNFGVGAFLLAACEMVRFSDK